MHSVQKKIVFFVILLIAIILPQIWLHGDYIYISEEYNFVNYQNSVLKNTYSWDSSFNQGNPVFVKDHSTIFPNGIFFYWLSKLNIPNHAIQKIYLSIIIFITLCASVYTLSLFTKNELIILSGALFLFFNFYVKSTMFYSAKMFQLILMPLFFAWLYQFLKTGKLKYVFYNYISFYIFQGIFTNLPTLFATLTSYILAIFYYLFVQKESVLNYFHRKIHWIIIFFAFLIPLFFYHLLLYYFHLFSSDTLARNQTFQIFKALVSPISFIYQGRGAWWETTLIYNSWIGFYDNIFVVLFSFFLFGVCFVSLLQKRPDRITIFWTIILLLSISLASGSSFYPPLYEWIFENIPLFFIFREPWAKFMPIAIFSMSVLFVINLDRLQKTTLTAMCIVFIILKSLPFFSFNFFGHTTQRWSIPFLKPPSYWYEYEKWTERTPQSSILSIPLDQFRKDWYKENIGNAYQEITQSFGQANAIFSFHNNAFGYLLDTFTSSGNPNVIKITHVDYALIQYDTHKDYSTYASDELGRHIASKFKEKPVKWFGDKLSLHAIKPENYLPQIYAAEELVTVGTFGALVNLINDDDYNLKTATLVKTQLPLSGYYYQDKIAIQTPQISYTRINPTKYTVNIQNAKEMFPLVFIQNFNPQWKAYIGNTAMDEKNHTIIHGYANGWFIDPQIICKNGNYCKNNGNNTYDMVLRLEYAPQKIFTIGGYINFFLFLSSIGYLIFVSFPRKNSYK